MFTAKLVMLDIAWSATPQLRRLPTLRAICQGMAVPRLRPADSRPGRMPSNSTLTAARSRTQRRTARCSRDPPRLASSCGTPRSWTRTVPGRPDHPATLEDPATAERDTTRDDTFTTTRHGDVMPHHQFHQ